jgi:hypothetical protein
MRIKMRSTGTRRHKTGLLLAFVFLAIVLTCVLLPTIDIDWDKPQREHQKTAYLEVRRLATALDNFRLQQGRYPRQLEAVRDTFVDNMTANDESHDRGFAEQSWYHVVDKRHMFGYVYRYVPFQQIGMANDSLFAHYELHADPLERGKTGFKSFFVSDHNKIRWNDERSANAYDPEPDVDPVLGMHSHWGEYLRHWKH